MKILKEYKYIYRINKNDAIYSIDQDWLNIAQENNAAHLTAERIIGEPLWKYIDGQEIHEIYQMLFSKLRNTKGMATIPYRCDSPNFRREFELGIVALDNGGLELKSQIVEIRSCTFNPLILPDAFRNSTEYKVCSFCKKVKHRDGEWDTLLHVFDLMHLNPVIVPKLVNALCPDCKQTIEKEI